MTLGDELAGPGDAHAYLMAAIDCCTREIVGWHLELRCRAKESNLDRDRHHTSLTPTEVLDVMKGRGRGTSSEARGGRFSVPNEILGSRGFRPRGPDIREENRP